MVQSADIADTAKERVLGRKCTRAAQTMPPTKTCKGVATTGDGDEYEEVRLEGGGISGGGWSVLAVCLQAWKGEEDL